MEQKTLNTAFLSLLFILLLLLTLITYDPHIETTNTTLQFLVDQHKTIMVFMAIFATAFGFLFSKNLQTEIVTKEKTNRELYNLFLSQLDMNERKVIEHLRTGPCTQAELSEIMSRVAAHRTIIKLEAKKLILVEQQGKTKKLSLIQKLQ